MLFPMLAHLYLGVRTSLPAFHRSWRISVTIAGQGKRQSYLADCMLHSKGRVTVRWLPVSSCLQGGPRWGRWRLKLHGGVVLGKNAQ